MVPAAAGRGSIVISKPDETVPCPQSLTPRTVRLPDVALPAKSIVTELPVPFITAPVPL
jgi:hypothetical protein